jgi:ABC-type multidrug transport system fused ATPase/permease subunit
MITFRRRISVFCMRLVRMLRILYLWFFISWWRLDAEFLCFVNISYECSRFFIFDSLSHDHVQTQNFCVLYASRTNAQNSLFLIFYLMMTFKRRISVFCKHLVKMLRILYLWFFISWSRFVCRTAQHASTWIKSSWFHHMFRTNKDK